MELLGGNTLHPSENCGIKSQTNVVNHVLAGWYRLAKTLQCIVRSTQRIQRPTVLQKGGEGGGERERKRGLRAKNRGNWFGDAMHKPLDPQKVGIFCGGFLEKLF
jgi:hypothetical protein